MARMGIGRLAAFCQRVATSLHAGIDVRRIWETESQRGSAGHRRRMQDIQERVGRGASLAEAFDQNRGYIPHLVCEMVDVGERTGQLDKVFFQMAEHYEQLERMRRYFLLAIAWPVLELGLALGVVGLLIWILGAIGAEWNGRPMSVLGLYGTRGLMIYLSVLAGIFGSIAGGVLAVRNGWVDSRPFSRLLMHVPGIGTGLRTMALYRLAWSMAIVSDTDLDVFKAVELAVRNTQSSFYTSHLERMRRAIRSGAALHEAFRATGAYPDEFLDALETGETAGRIVESMQSLARVLEDRARTYYKMLAAAAGLGVLGLSFAIVIFFIFQVAQLYLTPIYDTLNAM